MTRLTPLLVGIASSVAALVVWTAPAAGQVGPSPSPVPASAGSPGSAGSTPGPTLSPSPLPLAPGFDGVPLPDEPSKPGFFDVGGRVREAINGWLASLVESAVEPVMNLLGRTVFATPRVGGAGHPVRGVWALSLGIANGLFGLAVLAGGALVMGHETVQTRYSIKEIAPRLVLGFVAANTSLFLADRGIEVANALTAALLGQGVDPSGATASMSALLLKPIRSGSGVVILLGIVVAVFGLLLFTVWLARLCLTIALVAAAPLALACHALPQTEGLARLWWRAFAASLGVQVTQALLLTVAVKVLLDDKGRSGLGLAVTGPLVDLLVVICLLWALWRVPFWAARLVVSSHRSTMVGQATRYYVLTKVIKAAGAAGGA